MHKARAYAQTESVARYGERYGERYGGRYGERWIERDGEREIKGLPLRRGVNHSYPGFKT